ncbi:cofactor-independent phosphoglycerate mutase [Prevotella sp. A2931]|uniref:Cofactor-independent phosphoglycerate mutase n=1 Tax=Prevotella illustrans TaxID=2800387 RepID=A0ABS3M2Q3_9BACT|nr:MULTISPECIES: cofactor-independent phosphoglycerate mutase [Prevotella]MBO1362453.1 cofactor-independent phosphoglycerate mutase [Prevotella illustrans]PTL25035.1 cofactor-independent phosphoglycerate mutase [Prevotella sp. oral taxon 820]
MKHIIILGDGMADHAVDRLHGKTLLQYAKTPFMDLLAKQGQTGRLITIPDGFQPGSEIANTAILGYDLNQVYEGRGPLEAASIGYEMRAEDLALRCNLITLRQDVILTHNGGHLRTEDGDMLIKYLNEKLGNEQVRFITGIQYRHLLIIKNGSKHITCAPPHDHPNEPWHALLVKPERGWEGSEPGRMSPQATADLLNRLILESQRLLNNHPFNQNRVAKGERPANSIWPWGGGYKPSMQTLMEMFPAIHSGSVISAVDLIRGIGHYAGLKIIKVKGATGLADTNYEGKAAAALKELKNKDFVFLHIEASDEAGHDGNLELKLQTIESLDQRIVKTIYESVSQWQEPVCIAVLPDHPTPVEIQTHVKEPVPFVIWHKGIKPDEVTRFDEVSCVNGCYGLLKLQQFMQVFMNTTPTTTDRLDHEIL